MIESKKSVEEVTQWSDLEQGIVKTGTVSEVIKRAVAKFKDEAENYAKYLQDKRRQKKKKECKEDWKKKGEFKK